MQGTKQGAIPVSENSVRVGWVFLLFFSSGISGLVFQVVWVRMLTRLLGNTIFATATVLSAFMAGLAIGAYFFGRMIDKRQRPLRLYAFLEAAIAVLALLVPLLIQGFTDLYPAIYHRLAGGGTTGITTIQVLVSSLCLLLPTIAMGATLPVLGAFVSSRAATFGHNVGYLYGLNTLGAVIGALSSGMFLIGVIGEWGTISVGVAINILVAAIALRLSRSAGTERALDDTVVVEKAAPGNDISPYPVSTRQAIVLIFMASGFIALGYEIIWTRLLQIFTGPSIYAFTLMLSVYLAGIAIGSLAAARFVDRIKEPLYAFGILEMILGALTLTGLFLFLWIDTLNIGSYTLRMVLPCILVVFPPTIILGLMFPTVARCYTATLEEAGSSISHVYTLNTVGSIAGSLAVGFLLMPVLGSMLTVSVLAIGNTVLGVLALELIPKQRRKPTHYLWGPLGLGVTLLLFWTAPDPAQDVVKQLIDRTSRGNYQIYYNKEDVTSTVTSFGTGTPGTDTEAKHLWVNGYGMTTLTTDTKLIGHLPILLVPQPRKALVICFGMGTTYKSLRTHKDIEVTAVELIPNVFDCYRYYHPDGVSEPQHWIANDGRNHLLLTQERYDLITIDPPPPIFGAGTVNLYTKEFYQLCKRSLTGQGVLSQWIPGETPLFEFRMMAKTMQSVFPHLTMWQGPDQNGYFLTGSPDKLAIDYTRMATAWSDSTIFADLTEWSDKLRDPKSLQESFVMGEDQLRRFTGDVPIITDNHPYTEFPLTLHAIYGRTPYIRDAPQDIDRFKEPVDEYLMVNKANEKQ